MKSKSSFVDAAKLELHARILRCPLEDNPKDCPLHEVRKRPLEERLSWLYNRSDQELADLYAHHLECYELKTGVQNPETD